MESPYSHSPSFTQTAHWCSAFTKIQWRSSCIWWRSKDNLCMECTGKSAGSVSFIEREKLSWVTYRSDKKTLYFWGLKIYWADTLFLSNTIGWKDNSIVLAIHIFESHSPPNHLPSTSLSQLQLYMSVYVQWLNYRLWKVYHIKKNSNPKSDWINLVFYHQPAVDMINTQSK